MPVMMTASQFFFSARARTFRVGMRPRDTPCGALPQPWQPNTPKWQPQAKSRFRTLSPSDARGRRPTSAWKLP